MAKMGVSKTKRRSSPVPKASMSNETTLDQNEVLRAMLAAKKQGKQREVSDEDEEDDNDSDEDDSAGSSGSGEEDEASDGSAPESSASATSRSRRTNLKRSRSQSRSSSPSLNLKSDVKPSVSAHSHPTTTALPSRISSAVKAPRAPIVKPPSETSFTSLGLSQPIISALASISIISPTEIQSACIGPILAGQDCIGGAKTGSGKTMAFALPIVERIARDPFGIWAVVLTPTRELAYQLTEQFIAISKPLGLTTITVVGGMDMMAQAKALDARPHIVVATPGRLCDLLRSDGMSQGKLGRVKTLVLDEADRLLTPTFAPELAYLFSQMPANRQTCLFTATVNEALMQLADKPSPGKPKPFVYRVESDTLTVARLKQKYLFIPSQVRDPYLYYLLLHPLEDIDAALRADTRKDKAQPEQPKKGRKNQRKAILPEDDDETPFIPSTIIFTQRCATAHLLHLLLNSLDIPSVPLHSHLTQPQRLQSLARFRAHEVPVLVTTDVGSRGLDIPEVAMVVNWDCPRRADDYVHRVGRTARAGRGGVAITIITERDVELVKVIEKEVGVTLGELELPEEAVLEKLNAVSLARRMATMEMHDSGFGERQATNKAKQIKRAKRDAA
ncbi:P-loop containing nucleoside triphosphate hydrolase protein, partial [Naematelia encephala]